MYVAREINEALENLVIVEVFVELLMPETGSVLELDNRVGFGKENVEKLKLGKLPLVALGWSRLALSAPHESALSTS